MSFAPDIFTTGFAGLLFYFGLGIFEDGMVAEAIASKTVTDWAGSLVSILKIGVSESGVRRE
jgi:hypothetical protein